MAKLEVALLVGKESKEWLARAEAVLARMEALQGEEVDPSVPEDEVDETDDEDFAKKPAKKPNGQDFDDETELPEEAPEEEAPPVKKAKKLTVDDVNDACKKRAAKTGGKEGRNEVLTILKKKFKTTSVSELKPEQYAAAIAAMKS